MMPYNDIAIPIKAEPIEVITIKDEPVDAPDPVQTKPSSIAQLQNAYPNSAEGAGLINSQTNHNSAVSSSVSSKTVIKAYPVASICKYDSDTGRVLTLGQRLARIRKQQEECNTSQISGSVERVALTSPPPLTPTASASRDSPTKRAMRSPNAAQLDSFAGTNYKVAVKVLVTNTVQQLMYNRGKQYYKTEICKISRARYPEFHECQVYLKGVPVQVLDCLYVISDDICTQADRQSAPFNRGNREEKMYIVTDRRFVPELLRHYKGTRMIKHIEEENSVWMRLEEKIVEGECVISITGHRQQMRNGLRHLLHELSMSSYADSLPSLFHYIPSPHYHPGYPDNPGYHGNSFSHSPWVACDRTAWSHWLTFRDYGQQHSYSHR